MQPKLKIVVVNDLHPLSNPGAAGIAHSYAQELSNFSEGVEFWTTAIEGQLQISDRLKTRIYKFSGFKASRIDKSFKQRLFTEFANLPALIWFIKQLINSKPDIVWLHQIGFRFPKTIILACKFLRISTYVTIHDYNLILPRKLYPSDLGLTESHFNEGNFSYLLQKHSLLRSCPEKLTIKLYFLVRLHLLRIMFNGLEGVFAISDLQAEIYSSFGFRLKATIPNGFYPCSCENSVRLNRSILFAGRDVGKGLDKTIQAVRGSGWHLHLAGNQKLKLIASSSLDPSEFTYHGKLTQDDLFLLIHKMSFVAVISQCYDVFPSVALEAVIHGSLPLITPTCGNFRNILKLSDKLGIPLGEPPMLEEILSSTQDARLNARSGLRILTPREVVHIYFSYFN